jgi:hypothetical protein
VSQNSILPIGPTCGGCRVENIISTTCVRAASETTGERVAMNFVLRWKLLRMFGTTENRVLRLFEWRTIDKGGTGDMNCVDIVW